MLLNLSAAVWEDNAKSLLVSVYLYLAIALIVVLLGIGIIVKLKKPQAFSNFLKISVAIAIGFAIAILATMLALGFARIEDKGYTYNGIKEYVLIPALVLCIIVAVAVAAIYISSLFSKKAFKLTGIIASSVAIAMFVAFFICLAVYYGSGKSVSNNSSDPDDPIVIGTSESIILYVSAIVIVAITVLIAIFGGKQDKKGFDSKSISYAAICIAMSFALSYIKFFEMPQGGSVTLASLLPLMIYAYMYGPRKGVLAGFIYGILQAIQDPWIIHPAQFLLDYPLAFACIGTAGLFARVKPLQKFPQIKFALGAIVAAVLRYASHVLSGTFAFSTTPGSGDAWIYSLAYNSFVFVDLAIVIVVGILVFSVPSFVKTVDRVQANAIAKKSETSEKAETV